MISRREPMRWLTWLLIWLSRAKNTYWQLRTIIYYISKNLSKQRASIWKSFKISPLASEVISLYTIVTLLIIALIIKTIALGLVIAAAFSDKQQLKLEQAAAIMFLVDGIKDFVELIVMTCCGSESKWFSLFVLTFLNWWSKVHF